MVDAGAANIAVQTAINQIDKSYRFGAPAYPSGRLIPHGARTPKYFDCSGLTMWCWAKGGYNLIHLASNQQLKAKRPLDEAQPGDLVFFGNPAYHVAIVASPGTIIEAPDYGIPVRYRDISSNSTDIYKYVRAYPGQNTAISSGKIKLIDVIHAAGFQGSSADTAYAIALAESGGNVNAHNTNTNTGDNSYGLFQINMLGPLGPQRRSEFNLQSNVDLYNPLTNAQVAFVLSANGKNFGPWSTYNSGAYRKYLGTNEKRTIQGTGVDLASSGGIPDPSPPIPVTSLSVPLTLGQRHTIVNYLKSRGGMSADQVDVYITGAHANQHPLFQPDKTPMEAILAGDYDQKLVDTYKLIVSGIRVHTPGPGDTYQTIGGPLGAIANVFGTIGNLFSWLTNVENWKRIGLFLLGAIVLIFAAIKIFSDNGVGTVSNTSTV